jgi:hypothetical protein
MKTLNNYAKSTLQIWGSTGLLRLRCPQGGGGMLELEKLMPPKVSTPKMMRRAGELRQNQTEAESKL